VSHVAVINSHYYEAEVLTGGSTFREGVCAGVLFSSSWHMPLCVALAGQGTLVCMHILPISPPPPPQSLVG
jgi:hypothetical protein